WSSRRVAGSRPGRCRRLRTDQSSTCEPLSRERLLRGHARGRRRLRPFSHRVLVTCAAVPVGLGCNLLAELPTVLWMFQARTAAHVHAPILRLQARLRRILVRTASIYLSTLTLVCS